jgi:dihydrofolate synthase / folylpolyglutamate synthase
MTYQETIDFLYSRLPVFHHIGARAFKPGLHTTTELCKSLGNPQNAYPCIHVGGTNGKGSTSHMIASVLQHAGYRVGLYTSPHLKSFRERIKIDGEEVSEDFIIQFVAANLSNIDRFEPSFFELAVAMAFSYFERGSVDIAVIEVGMGGRLDSTNVITPILSLITNVSFDHTQFLGDTLVKIAGEKAGIIKESVPVVVSEWQSNEIAGIFKSKAESENSPLTFGSDLFRVQESKIDNGKLILSITASDGSKVLYPSLRLDLTGVYQLKNVSGVLAAVDQLTKAGYVIKEDALYTGLGTVITTTGLKGRWQKLNDRPDVYCDTAHNYAGLSDTLAQFSSLNSTQARFVIGFVSDKDVSAILRLFPKEGIFYFCQPSNPRALKASELHDIALGHGLLGSVYENVNDALNAALTDSADTDTIYVGGSTFVVADLAQL